MFKAYKNLFLPYERTMFIWISHKGQVYTYRGKI